MQQHYQPIALLLQRVDARWRSLVVARRMARGLVVAAALLAVALLIIRVLPPKPLLIALLLLASIGTTLGVLVVTLLSARQRLTDLQVARFIEERVGTLEQRLVTAVDVAIVRPPDERPAFAESMVRDAARVAATIAVDDVVRPEIVRRAVWQAAAATLALLVVVGLGRTVLRRALDATTLALFPNRISLDVTPGDARVEAGSALTIVARLQGNDAPVLPQVLRRLDGRPDSWQPVEMQPSQDRAFAATLVDVTTSFEYRVVAAGAVSKTFSVTVVRAPRVVRIDVEYQYPKAFGLAPRTEEDAGDIFAPAGTAVRVHIRTDAPAVSGQLVTSGNGPIALAPAADGRTLTGQLTITTDDAYRVGLADAHGLASRGDTEYFIRTLDDRPPDVHVRKPASDRRATPLEEIEIEAEASDDFGVAGLELVYTVQGGDERVVPLKIARGQSTVTANHVLYLEDLDLRPGDFLSYYIRARDVARGRRSTEASSDIFFLEIKHFEEEFTLAQSQAAMGGGASNPQLDELVSAQKEVIVATWKLDRRSSKAKAQSVQDIRAVATAETELKVRVDRVATALRTSAMRDPRARSRSGAVPRAGRSLTEEESLLAAGVAMTEAASALNALNTSRALPPEMGALNHLLKAQADIRKREVQRQQAGSGGTNRNTQDLSSLFDKELSRNQETNYENRSSAASREAQEAGATDQIKELAKRQDELLKRQDNLAAQRQRLSAEEMKRQLEQLTREQNDLRERAEDVARQIAGQQPPPGSQPPRANGAGERVQQGGTERAAGAAASERERRLGEITDDMRASARGLQRQDTDQARAGAERARDRLRALEQQLSSASAEGRRRALGDLQLEARQLADAERQIAAESRRADDSHNSADARRRLAGEQERVSDRVRDLQQRLRQQATGDARAGTAGSGPDDVQSLQQAAAEAGREIERQRLAERMRQSADALRRQTAPSPGSAGADDGPPGGGESRGQGRGQAEADSGSSLAAGSPHAQEEMARALDRIADRLASAGRGRDAEADRLSGQLARAQELRDRLTELTERMAELDRQAARSLSGAQAPARGGRSDQPSSGRRATAGAEERGAIASSAEVERLRADMNQQLKALRDLMAEGARAGNDRADRSGRTFEGQGMTLSAPGTEGFKQDFSRWQELTRQATAVLESIESSAAKRLHAKESKDRLTAGAEDRAPAGYQPQVDSYFKALAAKKKS